MRTYYTAEIADLNHIHPNTVRLYEKLGLLTPPERLDNSYRLFTELHLEQVRLIRLALAVEVLQNGLRKQMIGVLKAVAELDWQGAKQQCQAYLEHLASERVNAEESLQLAGALWAALPDESAQQLSRQQMAQALGITVETLRNWERNGLLGEKHFRHGKRVYDAADAQRLKLIRTLRCANYSLTAILRLLSAPQEPSVGALRQIIDTPAAREEIISVCDQLLTSLERAEANGQQVLAKLEQMAEQFANPPL